MGLMKGKILLTKLHNTFYPEKKCLHFPLPVSLSYLSVPNSLSLQLSSDSNMSRSTFIQTTVQLLLLIFIYHLYPNRGTIVTSRSPIHIDLHTHQ